MYSENILAIDAASLELANKQGFEEKVHKNINKDKQIQIGEEEGLGEMEYKIIEI